MKKLFIIYISIFIAISSFAQEYCESGIQQTPSLDTSKLKRVDLNILREEFKNDDFDSSLKRVRSMYYGYDHLDIYDRDILNLEKRHHSRIFVHHIVDNKAFNKLQGVEMYYEIIWGVHGISERVIARYEGVYYEIGALDDLLINTGLIETISVEEKIHIILQWHYWLVDQNIEIVNLEKVIDREDWGQYEGQVRVDGEICNIWRIIVRGRQSFFSDIIINCEDVGGMNMIFGKRSSDTKSGNENIKLNHNNNDIVPRNQDPVSGPGTLSVYYYNHNHAVSNITTLTLENFDIYTDNKQIRIVKRYPSPEIHSTITSSSASDDVVDFNISGLETGYYTVDYRNSNGDFTNILGLVLLPQNVETRQITYTGGNFDVNFYYLRQFFSSDVAVTTYLNIIENDVKVVANETHSLMPSGYGGEDLNIVLQYPGSQMPITIYHHKFDDDWLGTFGYSTRFSEMPTIDVKNGLPNNRLAAALAHEMFHWIIRENSNNLKNDPSLARKLDWLDEGLCVMAQALVFPNYEINQSNSLFMEFSNGFISAEYTSTGNSYFYESLFKPNLSSPSTTPSQSPYRRGLFFYYMQDKAGLISIKQLLENIDFYSYSNNTYLNDISQLFNAALNSSNYSHNADLLLDFGKEFIRKQYLSTHLNYNNLKLNNIDITQTMTSHYVFDNPVYSRFAVFRKTAPQGGINAIGFDVLSQNTTYGAFSNTGSGDFNVIIGIWSSNGSFLSLDNISGFFDQTSDIQLSTPVMAGQQIIVLVQKLHDTNPGGSNDFRLRFMQNTTDSPHLDFTANNRYPNQGGTVNYQVNSNYNILNYEWTFAGGTPGSSTQPNPSVTYNNSGAYSTTLKITDQNYDVRTISKPDYINVIPPNQTYSIVCYADDYLQSGQSVFATVHVQNANYDDEFRYVFDFGDGSNTVQEYGSSYHGAPNHIYYSPGTYQMFVQVYDMQNNHIGHCSSTINVLDISSPISLSLSVTPNEPLLGTNCTITAHTNALMPFSFNLFRNGVLIASEQNFSSTDNYFYIDNITEPNTDGDFEFTYQMTVWDNSPRSQGSASATINIPVPDQCITASIDYFCAQKGQPMNIRSNSHNSCGFDLHESTTIFSNITDIRWTLIRRSFFNNINKIDQKWVYIKSKYSNTHGDAYIDNCLGHHNYNICAEHITCDINMPSWILGQPTYYLVLEVWDRNAFETDTTLPSYEAITLYTDNEDDDAIFYDNYHLSMPFYDKIWIEIDAEGSFNNNPNDDWFCGHKTENTVIKRQEIVAPYQSFANCYHGMHIRSPSNIEFIARDRIVLGLNYDFSIEAGAKFIAKLACGEYEIFHTCPEGNKSIPEDDPEVFVELYPNPTSDYLNIDIVYLDEQHNITGFGINIYDITGKLIDKFTSNNPYNLSFNIGSYNPAEYLVEIAIANTVVTKKVVKQ